MLRKRECHIQNTVQIICPHCGAILQLPMCKAVNGEEFVCQYCQNKIKFGI